MGDGTPDPAVVEWLLDSDPVIRWQVLRDLTAAPADEVAAERGRLPGEGWAADLLARQDSKGGWGGEPDATSWTTSPEWFCLMSLQWLREMGLDPASGAARRATDLVREHVTWQWWDHRPFFDGEVEPCINGRVLAIGAYFGQPSHGLVERFLAEQMDDGGWNCEQENGSTRGSFDSTINVLEGLAEHEARTGGSDEIRAARRRGEEFLLERRLLRRLSTGELIDPAYSRLSFPAGYHYDVLRALEHFRHVGASSEPRMAEALEVIRSKRGADGRWPLETRHRDRLEVEGSEAEGEPSRWITLGALRVLRWAEGGDR
jgi:hypothetical protein